MKRDFLVAAVGIFGIALLVFYADRSSPDATTLDVPAVRAALTADIREHGGESAYASFKNAYGNSEFDRAHNAAHIFGESLFDVLGIEGVLTCDRNFNFGCYHGFFTKAVAADGLNVVSSLDTACMRFESPTACQHGIGHGILEYVGHARLEEALSECKKTHQPDPLAGCTSGVFMEYNVPLSVAGDGSFALLVRPLENPAEPYAPCPSLPEEFRLSCYHELPQWWAQVFGQDFKQLGVLCAAAPAPEKRACFEGLGNIIASFAEYEPESAIDFCSAITDVAGREECYMNAAWSVYNEGSDPAGAARICALLSPTEQEKCPGQ